MTRDEAIAALRKMLKPGDTVYTIVTHVSRSGMSRCISLRIMRKRQPADIDHLAAWALEMRRDEKNGGLKVGGCGMDMCFYVVYELSRALFPDGFQCVGEACPSNDHTNGDRDYAPHLHKSGGYALRKRRM